jgi:hypothetical protein
MEGMIAFSAHFDNTQRHRTTHQSILSTSSAEKCYDTVWVL